MGGPPQGGPLLPPPRGRAETGPGWLQAALAWLRGGSGEGAASAWAPGVGAPGEGPQRAPGHPIARPGRVRKRGRECASEDERGCNLGEVCAHLCVSYPERRVPHPSPLPTRLGEAHLGLAGQWGSPAATQGKLPDPGRAPLRCPECAKPSRAGSRPDLWGMVREPRDSGPSRLENGLGQPPRVLKLAPGGRRAQ